MDLVGFGQSGRKTAVPLFDYALWVRQARAMLSQIPGGSVGLIGHSLSGSIALTVAANNPRIGAVLTTGAMGAPFEPNEVTRRTWTCPTNREELRLTLQGLIHDASLIDEPYLAAREPVVFASGYAEYFNSMFAAEPRHYIAEATVDAATLGAVRCRVVLMHGRDDQGFPASTSMALADQLPRADLVLLADCSHSVAFERPGMFLAIASELFAHVGHRNHS
jgi:pimeloyl-ACP methyl ester carboxylesterase